MNSIEAERLFLIKPKGLLRTVRRKADADKEAFFAKIKAGHSFAGFSY